MARQVQGKEVQLEGETLRAMATAITRLNGLKELTAQFVEGEETARVRADLPEFLELKNADGDAIATVTRRSDGTWALSAFVTTGGS